MNICFISSHELDPTYGGTERVSYNLSQEMVRRGHGVFCCFMYNVPNKDFVSSVDSVQLPYTDSDHISENCDILSRYITQNGIDVLMFQSHHSVFWDVCVAAKKNTGVKLIYNLHSDPRSSYKEVNDRFAKIVIEERGVKRYTKYIWNAIKLPYTYYSRHKYFKNQYNKFYNECDQFVLLSDKFMPAITKLLSSQDVSKLNSITNPVLLSDTIIQKKQKEIVFVGRAEILNKRPDRVLDAWRKLYAKHPDWSLVMVGDGAGLPYLKEYAQRKGIQRVLFTGQTNPMPYFSRATISCVTSTHEGFGMVIIEAQQNGCIPVVYDSYESLHDIIDSGKNGYIIPAFDERKFVAQLAQIMDNPELCKEMSETCRENTNKFNLSNIVDQWEELYKDLLS